MRNLIKTVVISAFVVMSANAFGQSIDKLKTGITKGNLTLSSGKVVKFKNLQLKNDSTMTYTVDGNTVEQTTSDVFKVTKVGNAAGIYALSCGAGGLLGSLSAASNVSNAGYSGSNYVLICTAGGALVGALIGAFIKTEKTVFKNTSSLSLHPSLNLDQFGKYYPALSLNINL